MAENKTALILKGAGATFPYPLYETWIKVYEKDTRIRINYEAIGSGGGIHALQEREVDFGATDAFLSDKEMTEMKTNVLHIPTCLGAVVIIYNLAEKPKIRLTPQLISDIFTGKIIRWSDKKIAKVNPGLKLPDLKITVVHRSESSGTTYIFTNYLATVSSQWQTDVGAGKLVKWPTGIGIETNPGVANLVKKIEGAIGYVELNFAVQAGLPIAQVKNKSGNFIMPDMISINLAASIDMPKDTRTLIINTFAPNGYPISAFTWLIFCREQNYDNRSLNRARSLADFLWWAVHEGQNYNNKMNYGILSPQAVQNAENIIRSMTYEGKPLLDR
jgi:phosphate transport system substrate-binding protein